MENPAYKIIDGSEGMILPEVMRLLKQTCWAADRSREQVASSMRNSRCYGVIWKEDRTLVGFARVISDFSTTYYLCDVVIDATHRGQGLGTALVSYIESQPMYQGLRGMLITRDAHGLYAPFGYEVLNDRFMVKGLNW